MKTQIPGIKTCEMIVSQTCRKTHGETGALDIAIEQMKGKYWEALSYEANKNATLRFVLTIDRD